MEKQPLWPDSQQNETSLTNDMYTSALVSFGNYILKMYGVKKDIHGNDATVSDADLADWRLSLDEAKSDEATQSEQPHGHVALSDNLDSEE